MPSHKINRKIHLVKNTFIMHIVYSIIDKYSFPLNNFIVYFQNRYISKTHERRIADHHLREADQLLQKNLHLNFNKKKPIP